MTGVKPYSTPLATDTKLSQTTGDPLQDVTTYKQVVDALQYCALTHPKHLWLITFVNSCLHLPLFTGLQQSVCCAI